jgi:hypothetical protein
MDELSEHFREQNTGHRAEPSSEGGPGEVSGDILDVIPKGRRK